MFKNKAITERLFIIDTRRVSINDLFISSILFAIFLTTILAYWCFSAFFPKAPPTTLSCLLIRTILGVLLIIIVISLILTLLSQIL